MITIELEKYEELKDRLKILEAELAKNRKSVYAVIYEDGTLGYTNRLRINFSGTHTQLVARIKKEIQPNIDACNRTNEKLLQDNRAYKEENRDLSEVNSILEEKLKELKHRGLIARILNNI